MAIWQNWQNVTETLLTIHLPFKRTFKDTKSSIKAFFFRVRYGYDYRDCWSLDYSVAVWLLPKLKHLRNNHCGHPCEMTDDEWVSILDEMIEGFEIIGSDRYWDIPFNDSVEHQRDNQKVERALDLFRKYFRDLWD